jgi:tyrosyl-tRNA synthetase
MEREVIGGKHMQEFKSEILRVLHERDFIYQSTDMGLLDQAFCDGRVTGYIGFDATARSLQVGNLSAIMLLRWLQKMGHVPIVLVGGGTSRVGDPSFRQVARPIMSLEQIQQNIDEISQVFSKLLDFTPDNKLSNDSNGAIVLNNADWLTELKYIDFLRDYGTCFTVNRMLSFDSIRSRLEKEEPLSFLEFNYMIMQAYDFYYINQNFGCTLQMGGSDQWGNIVNGVELTRRLAGREVFGLTAPLVTDASGAKMGKTAAGAVWLNPGMCSPFEYWQFWRNTDDRDVIKFIKKFTELPMEEINRLSKLQNEEINDAKKILADEATALLHGRAVLGEIHDATSALFAPNGDDKKPGEWESAIPTISLWKAKLPVSYGDVFVVAGLCSSKSEFKRLVEGRGVSVQSKVITDSTDSLNINDFSDGGVILSLGKKRHVRIVLGGDS